MRIFVWALLLVLAAPLTSALLVTPGCRVAAPRTAAAANVQMGPAKDGPFTPFVLGAKVRLHGSRVLAAALCQTS